MEFEVQIATNKYIYCCPKCGLAIPSDLFSKHVPPNQGECANRISGGEFTSYKPHDQMPVHLALLIEPYMLLFGIANFIMQLVSEHGEPIIPPGAEHWLDQLNAVYNDQEQEANFWLADLIDTAQTLWNVIYKDEKPNLVELGRRVDQYKTGLDILYKWLADEFHNATT